MSTLVLAGGQSVTDYPGQDLAILAKASFTFGVNNSGFIWPCDVIVALDSDWIRTYANDLKELGRPIITRDWGNAVKGLGLDLIEVPNAIRFRLSGMVAAKLADTLANRSGGRNYVVGLDHTAGHYYNEESDCTKIVTLDDYERMGLTNTHNLGIHSKIKCWPKLSKLPKWQKCAVSKEYRQIAIAWLRGEAGKILG